MAHAKHRRATKPYMPVAHRCQYPPARRVALFQETE